MDCAALHRSMGVHISFVRSTDLDKWKPHELKAMEAGGNAKAKAFMRDHGVLDMEKIESKYHTSAAQQYKNKIRDLTSDAPKKKPTSVLHYKQTDTTTDTTSKTSSTTNGNRPTAKNSPQFNFDGFDDKEDEEKEEKEEPDFFDRAPTKAPAKAAATKAPAKSFDEPQFTPAANPSTTTPEFSRKPATTAKATGKLGAKKVSSSKSFFADFDLDSDEEKEEEPSSPVASPQAEEVSTRFSRLSYDDAPPRKNQSQSNFNNNYNSSPSTNISRENSGRGGRGNTNQPSKNRDDGPDYARQKFSNAKSISSDQYFGLDKEKENNYEKETRLARFQGARAISSADYYERDESVTIADMSAGDVARRIAYNAKSDFSQLSTVVVEGGKKLSAMANSMISDLQDRYS